MPGSINLQTVKLVHTIIWAFFAGCILAIPVTAWLGAHATSLWLVLIVFVEVLVLVVNKWSCPLTAVAARYTDDRRENFDIYLPLVVAKYNKEIFGTLYGVGTLYAAAVWVWR